MDNIGNGKHDHVDSDNVFIGKGRTFLSDNQHKTIHSSFIDYDFERILVILLIFGFGFVVGTLIKMFVKFPW